MEPLDPQLRQLIEESMPAAMPDDDAHDRGLAALVAHIEGAPPPVPPAAPATAGLTKLLVGVAAVGAVATGGWVATRPPAEPAQVVRVTAPAKPSRRSAAPPAPPQPPRVVPAAPAEPATPPAAAPPAPTSKAERRPAAPTPTPEVSVADRLRAEADLVARAQSALDRNKPREALALCDFHRKGYDAPQLTTERKAIAASAACMIDATDTAAAEAFLRLHPKGALAKKVRQHCDLVDRGRKVPTP